VVEATASYAWLWELLEPLADQLVLAHPKKLRVIAESTRKSDRLDAQVLAEFLPLEMIPQAYGPSPRQRQHRLLVRQRAYLGRQITSTKNKMRRLLSDHNAGPQRSL
jgi:transposase